MIKSIDRDYERVYNIIINQIKGKRNKPNKTRIEEYKMSKFRLWDKRFSEFVEDFFVSEDGKIYKKSTDTGYGIAISRETSDKVILMQSTGLFDAFGTEIFEGDIVTKNQGETFGVIRYGICQSSLCFYVEQNFKGSELTYPINPNFSRYYKVAGNIFENAKLLGQ